MKVVTTFTDDLSWRIRDMLVDSYFRLKDVLKSAEQSLELMRVKDELIDTQRKLIDEMQRKKITRRPFSEEEKQTIMGMHSQGLTQGEIRRQTGRGKALISNVIRFGNTSGRPVTA